MNPLPTSIGFSAGLLNEEAIRMDVIGGGTGWVALNKPSHIAFEDHPWQNGVPHIIGALRVQLELAKPEILKLGLKEPASVYGPEPEVSGVAIIADRASSLSDWRDALGSFQLEFEYTFIARTEDAPEEGGLCDLPIGMDDTRSRAFISRQRGKQAETTFTGGEAFERWRVWTAHTRYPRRDQVRIHANECGLRIAGELHYARTGRVTLTDTVYRGRINKGEDKPLHRSLLLHLGKISGNVAGVPFSITAPLPDDFSAVLKRLKKSH